MKGKARIPLSLALAVLLLLAPSPLAAQDAVDLALGAAQDIAGEAIGAVVPGAGEVLDDKAKDVTLWEAIEKVSVQFREKLLEASKEIERFEMIHRSLSQHTDMARDIYDVGLLFTKRGTDIRRLYDSYTSGKSAAENMALYYQKLLAGGRITPSHYVRLMAMLTDEVTRLTRSFAAFLKFFASNDIKMDFYDRLKELDRLLTEWDISNKKWKETQDDIEEQEKRDSAEVVKQKEYHKQVLSAYGTTGSGSDILEVDPMPSMHSDPEAVKEGLRQALKPFSVGGIYDTVMSIILIISGILAPMALWLYFKGDGARHKDAFIKLLAGLLISLLIMSLLKLILGPENLTF